MQTQARSRDKRNKTVRDPITGRDPAIWRSGAIAQETEFSPAVPQVGQKRRGISGRILSGLVSVSLIAVLALLFNSDAFYVHNIQVDGLDYMSDQEIFRLADIANTHIFWVDPQIVRENIMRSQTISSTTVNVAWGSPMVRIVVQERQPAVIWEQSGISVWVDLQGRIMLQRENRSDLIRITADVLMDGVPSTADTIDTAIVNGALQLSQLLPDRGALRYHPTRGLGYTDVGGWDVWLGTGTNMPEKILIYQALVANLQARGIVPGMINVSNPDAVVYSVISGR